MKKFANDSFRVYGIAKKLTTIKKKNRKHFLGGLLVEHTGQHLHTNFQLDPAVIDGFITFFRVKNVKDSILFQRFVIFL